MNSKIKEMADAISAELHGSEESTAKSSKEEMVETVKKLALADGRVSKHCWQDKYDGEDGKKYFGKVKVLTWEKFTEISSDTCLQQWQDELTLLAEKYPNGGDDYESEKKLIKNNFPLITEHALGFVGDGRRTNDNALQNREAMYDNDNFGERHPDVDMAEWLKSKLTSEFIAENNVHFAHKSVSGKGFHIVFGLHKGETISGGQLRMNKALGLADDEYDSQVYEPSRGSYIVHKSYWILPPKKNDWYFADTKAAVEAAEEGKRVLNYANNNIPKANNTQSKGLVLSGEMPEHYNGAKWEYIVQSLISSLGGEPQQGTRHDMYGSLCAYMHGLVGNNPQWLYNVLPKWNSYEEQMDQCEYYCNQNQNNNTANAKVVRAAVIKAQEMTRNAKYDTSHLQLPPLTELDRLILSQLPEQYHTQMLLAMLPIKGCLFHGSNFYNLSNSLRHFGFGAIIIGYPGSGKSFCNKAMELLLTPLRARDEEQAQLMADYKESKQLSKNKVKQDKDPQVYLSIIQNDTTLAKMAYYIGNANGDTLFTTVEEIDEVRQVEKSAYSAKKILYRDAYDGFQWGQDRYGIESVTARGSVRINNLWKGTPGSVMKFIDLPELENGLASRQIFITMPPIDPYLGTPQFPDYKGKTRNRILEIITEMYSTTGTYYAPFVKNAVERWKQEKLIENVGGNPYKDQYINRAAETAERAAYMYAIEDGSAFKSAKSVAKNTQKERNAVEYSLWIAEMIYRSAMQLFESKLDRLTVDTPVMSYTKAKYCPERLYADLPTVFDTHDIDVLMDQNNWHVKKSVFMSHWKNKDNCKCKVIDNGDGTYTKVK